MIHRSQTPPPPPKASMEPCSPLLMHQLQQELPLQPYLYQPQPVSMRAQHAVVPTDTEYSEDEALTATPYDRSPIFTPYNPDMPCTGIPAAGDAPRLSLDPDEASSCTMNPQSRSPRRPATSLQRYKQCLRRIEKCGEPSESNKENSGCVNSYAQQFHKIANKENSGSGDNYAQNFDKKVVSVEASCGRNMTRRAVPVEASCLSEDIKAASDVEVVEVSIEQSQGKVSSPPGKHFAWQTLPDMACAGQEDALSRPVSLLPAPLTMKPLKKWTVDDVKTWVVSTPVPPQVADLLSENAINGPVLESLTDKDLVGLGIQKFGWRRQLLLSRKELCDKLGPKFFNIYSSTPSLAQSDDVPSPGVPSPVNLPSVPPSQPDSDRGMEPSPRALSEAPLSHRCSSTPCTQSPLSQVAFSTGPFGTHREFISFAPCARSVSPAPMLRGTSVTRTSSPCIENHRQGWSPARQRLANLHIRGGCMLSPRVVNTPTQCIGPVVQAQAVCRTSSPTPRQILAASGPVLTARRAASQPRRSGSPAPALRTHSPGPALKRARSPPAVQRSRSPVATGPPIWLV